MIFICDSCKQNFKESPANRKLPHIFCGRKCQHEWWVNKRPERFWEKVKKIPNSCWVWIGGKTSAGYGQFCGYHVHRFSYELVKGKIPKGKIIMHKCDNPSCVNPSHLILGSQRDNLLDCSRKGRINRGEDRPQHKLTTNQVVEIRRLYREKRKSFPKLAKIYHVSEKNIFNIIHRYRWKHI